MMKLDEQNRRIRNRFPAFRLISLSDRQAIWEGNVFLRKGGTPYNLRIEYQLPLCLVRTNPTAIWYPRVYIMKPELELRHPKTKAQLPHVWTETKTGRTHLCLFAADQKDWSYSDPLSQTTIPDACEWLFFYEGWLATGNWHGGGIPHITNEEDNHDNKQTFRWNPSNRALKAALEC